jgi:capsular polysaccharide biosynthesis protein
MDPVAVIRAMFRYKSFLAPVLLLTVLAAIYVFQFGPRYYEAGTSFAVVNPRVPTDRDLLLDPSLAKLNGDNPFLRSSDQSLISEVVISRLASSEVSDVLKADGLSTDYTVTKGINGNGFVISITARGDSEEQALKTASALGDELQQNLRAVQKVNNADDRFLFTGLAITPLSKATEQFSSRLRSVIMVVFGGTVLMFGAVSMARSMEAATLKRHRRLVQKDRAGQEVPGVDGASEKRGSSDSHGVDTPIAPRTKFSPAPTMKRRRGPQPGTRRSNRISLRPQGDDPFRTPERVTR